MTKDLKTYSSATSKKSGKIQLKHPAGKHAVRMDKEKYLLIRQAILKSLQGGRELSHKMLLQSVVEYFEKKQIVFEGSVEWFMESVKLDMEAEGIIERISSQSMFLFRMDALS
ncbi:hypothetical protein QTN47_16835 [Danxiaibacter flavus]|uniref:Uncharacterized protein n=1 Tax=Danxiaibacter flavus TaxID=3049108 RepID=A0ABV3ZGZ8_9BACT|nr:hypothetical protein QNM32_16845 [Chitinophagaceae bacterium DXS]